jgi:predicted Zn-dependent protease
VTTTAQLAAAAAAALEYVGAQPGVRECEVFVASNANLIARLNYTSAIPSNGVEEPKSTESQGIGLQVAFDSPGGPLIGFGAEPSDLGIAGVERALDKARRGAVADPDFVSLPRPGIERRRLTGYHDPRLLDVLDEDLVRAGWRVVRGGLRTFATSPRLLDLAGGEAGLRRLGLLLGGDVGILQERVAIASTHMPAVQTDESTLLTAFVTAMVEAEDAKGSGWSTGIRLDEFTDEAGIEAAANAIAAIGGERVPTGDYTVIFGKQPVADLLNNLVVPACTAGAIYSCNTPFLGKLGQRVMSPRLSIYDDGAVPGYMGSKGITCEGLPTGRTELITRGVFTGCLSNWYEQQRLLRDPDLAEKLGASGHVARDALAPRNGFRFDTAGGRLWDAQPGTSASNMVVEGTGAAGLPELIQDVEHGLYIGRIWYTYPINGLRAGDFTCTVVGDSYVIRDGRLAAPLQANALRINDNVVRVLENVIGVTRDVKGTLVWGADEVTYAPEIACRAVHVEEIAGFMTALGGAAEGEPTTRY